MEVNNQHDIYLVLWW